MSQTHNCPCAPECVLQGALNTIGGKWKLPILCSLLSNGASRYNELLKTPAASPARDRKSVV